MKSFAFIFSFLLIFANLAFVQPSESFAKTLDEAVTISVLDAEGGDIVGMQAVEIEDGDTALDVLEEVAEVETEDSSWGPMIVGINGQEPVWEDNGAYWHFAVNGQAAQTGADQVTVNHADNILFLYKNNDHEEVNVDVTIDGQSKGVKLDPFSTAYDALKQATNQLDIPFEVTIDDQWFAFITKLTDRELAGNEYWGFMVNEQFAETGVSAYRLSQSDKLSFEVDSFELEEEIEEENSETGQDDESNDDNDINDEEANETEDNEETNEHEGNEDDQTSTDEEATEETEETTEVNKNLAAINEQVTNDLTNLKKEIENRGLLSSYGHEPYVWAYAKAGGQVSTEYRDNIAKELKNEDNFTTTTNELAKVIIALSVAGFNATDVDGVDLVDMLIKDENILSGTSVATPTYVLHALDVGNYDVSESIKQALIDKIMEKQTSSGGWGFMGDTPSPDMTGMVLNTLAPYKSDDRIATAADKALDYLADGFDGTGWYHDTWSGGYTSEAISQVIVGLSAYGVDPTVAPFVDDEGKALLSYLLAFKADDGLYKHVENGNSDIGFATSQAFLALAYYKDAFIQETELPNPEEPEGPEEADEHEEETPSSDNDDKDKNDNDTKSEADGTTTTTDDSNVKPTENTTKTDEAKDETLPQTNSNVFNVIAVGLLSLAVGVVLVVLRKKWQSA